MGNHWNAGTPVPDRPRTPILARADSRDHANQQEDALIPGVRLCDELTRLSIPFRVDGNLSDLDLSGASLTNDVLSKLLIAMQTWPIHLQHLNLSHNRLTNAAVESLIQVAAPFGFALCIDLSYNNITDLTVCFRSTESVPKWLVALNIIGNPLIEPSSHLFGCGSELNSSELSLVDPHTCVNKLRHWLDIVRYYTIAQHDSKESARLKLIVTGAVGSGKSFFIETCFGQLPRDRAFQRASHVPQTFFWSSSSTGRAFGVSGSSSSSSLLSSSFTPTPTAASVSSTSSTATSHSSLSLSQSSSSSSSSSTAAAAAPSSSSSSSSSTPPSVPPLSFSAPPGSTTLSDSPSPSPSSSSSKGWPSGFGLKDAIQSLGQSSPRKLMATLKSPRSAAQQQQQHRDVDLSIWEMPAECRMHGCELQLFPRCRAVYVCLFRASLSPNQARSEVNVALSRVKSQFDNGWREAFATGSVQKPSVILVGTHADQTSATRQLQQQEHTSWLRDRQFRAMFSAYLDLPEGIIFANYDNAESVAALRSQLMSAAQRQLASVVTNPFEELLAAIDDYRADCESRRLFLTPDEFLDAFQQCIGHPDHVRVLWDHLDSIGEALIFDDQICVEPQRLLLMSNLFERMQQEHLISKRSVTTTCRYLQQQIRVPRTFTVDSFCRAMQRLKLWCPIGPSHYFAPYLLPTIGPAVEGSLATECSGAVEVDLPTLSGAHVFAASQAADGFMFALRSGLVETAALDSRHAVSVPSSKVLFLSRCAHSTTVVTTEERLLDHPNLVKLIGIALKPGLLLATEEYERLSALLSWRATSDPLPWSTRLLYLNDVCSGLEFLHHRQLVHGSVCSEHVFLTRLDMHNERTAKLCYLPGVGTASLRLALPPQWLAPELIANGATPVSFSEATDIYSFGMLLYEVLTHDAPWRDFGSGDEAHQAVARAQQAPLLADRRPHQPSANDANAAGAPLGYWRLIEQCWLEAPAERPSSVALRRALEHLTVTAPATSTSHPVLPISIAAPSRPAQLAQSASIDDVEESMGTLADLRISLDNLFSPAQVELTSKCYSCERPLYSKQRSRFCHFLGQWHCNACHRNDRALIPARVVLGWDLTRYSVSKRSAACLAELSDLAVIDVYLLNPQLYGESKELNKLRRRREELCLVTKFGTACPRYDYQKEFPGKLHLIASVHVYSMHDLVNRKGVSSTIESIRRGFVAHISNCSACCGRGFYCAKCEKGELLFPYQTTKIHRCPGCRAVFHKHCFDPNQDPCITCERRESVRAQLRPR